MYKYMFKNIFYSIKNRLSRKLDDNDINLDELKKMQKSGAEIIDVRSEMEYKEGHIEGAINIPEYEFKNSFKRLNVSKDKIIVVYCSSGIRSKRVFLKLKKMGYNNIYNLYGGLEEY